MTSSISHAIARVVGRCDVLGQVCIKCCSGNFVDITHPRIGGVLGRLPLVWCVPTRVSSRVLVLTSNAVQVGGRRQLEGGAASSPTGCSRSFLAAAVCTPGRDTTESIAGSDHVNRQWQTKELCPQAQKARTNDRHACRSSSVFPGGWGGRASSSWSSAVMGTGYISRLREETAGFACH